MTGLMLVLVITIAISSTTERSLPWMISWVTGSIEAEGTRGDRDTVTQFSARVAAVFVIVSSVQPCRAGAPGCRPMNPRCGGGRGQACDRGGVRAPAAAAAATPGCAFLLRSPLRIR